MQGENPQSQRQENESLQETKEMKSQDIIFILFVAAAVLILLMAYFSYRQLTVYPEYHMATVTSYSARETCPDTQNCLTASGKHPKRGMVACPRLLALGTIVEIKGETYVCEDRTAKRFDGRYDIWSDSYQASKDFGIHQYHIYQQ